VAHFYKADCIPSIENEHMNTRAFKSALPQKIYCEHLCLKYVPTKRNSAEDPNNILHLINMPHFVMIASLNRLPFFSIPAKIIF